MQYVPFMSPIRNQPNDFYILMPQNVLSDKRNRDQRSKCFVIIMHTKKSVQIASLFQMNI